MSGRAILKAVSAIRDCALVMLENASYIRRELPNVEMPEALRSQTAAVCDSMIGTKHDVVSEVFEIDELLNSKTDRAEVLSRIGRVIRWLREDISRMHQVVMALREDSRKNRHHTLGLILVQESTANIANAFNCAEAAVDTLESQNPPALAQGHADRHSNPGQKARARDGCRSSRYETDTENYLDNKGTKLWSVLKGTGTPLILCNGGPGCDDYLDPVSEMIEDLCAVVRFEQRGCGRSDWDKRYDLETTIGDIEFIRGAYGFDKVIVGGHSAGVGFCLAYALRYPERTMGIVGVSGGSIVDDREWFETYRANLEKYGDDNGGKVYRADPDANRIGNATWRSFIRQPTLLRDVSRLGIPAIFINGGDDIRPNWPTVQLARLLRNGEYVEIAGAGHYIWISRPDELRVELRKAVKKIVAQQAPSVDMDGPH